MTDSVECFLVWWVPGIIYGKVSKQNIPETLMLPLFPLCHSYWGEDNFMSQWPVSASPQPAETLDPKSIHSVLGWLTGPTWWSLKALTLGAAPSIVHHLLIWFQVLDELLMIPLWCQTHGNNSNIGIPGRMNIKGVHKPGWMEYILMTICGIFFFSLKLAPLFQFPARH